MAYSAFEITESDRKKLEAVFPPKFADFIGYHVTWEFGVDPATATLPDKAALVVYGYCADDSLECLAVSYNGSERRPDGALLHLTWSLDRSAGRKPVDSNKLLKSKPVEMNVVHMVLTCVPKFFK